jgi:hypothetical protein
VRALRVDGEYEGLGGRVWVVGFGWWGLGGKRERSRLRGLGRGFEFGVRGVGYSVWVESLGFRV